MLYIRCYFFANLVEIFDICKCSYFFNNATLCGDIVGYSAPYSQSSMQTLSWNAFAGAARRMPWLMMEKQSVEPLSVVR